MILFTNHAAEHFAHTLHANQEDYVIKYFSDGEIFVRINEDLTGKKVWIIAGMQPPADNLLELFFLLDAAHRAGASINLLITYFSYARQLIPAPGQAHRTEVISAILKQFPIAKIVIMHPHTLLLNEFLIFEPGYAFDFFCTQAKQYDTIAAPDKGAFAFAQKVAQTCNKNLVVFNKTRPDDDEVKIVSVEGEVAHKKILLIDDIISTGRTLVAAAQILKSRGALSVSAAATHGIFAPGSRQFMQHSILEKIYVTNTIHQESSGKITVIDISKTLNTIIMQHS